MPRKLLNFVDEESHEKQTENIYEITNRLISMHITSSYYLFQEWDDFYPSESISSDISTVSDKNTINLASNGHHYVHDVSFIEFLDKSLNYHSSSSDQTLLLVERSLFNSNSGQPSDGGNICFKSTGQFVQNKCCCKNCTCNSYGIHSYASVTNNANSKNFVIQFSFSEVFGNGNSQGMFRSHYGLFQFHHLNITNCKDGDCSCFSSIAPNNDISLLSSNFKNNTSTGNQGITFEFSQSYTIKINQCNVVTQKCGRGFGVLLCRGYTIIDSCVIKDNVAGDNFIFCFDRGAEITNSYIHNPGATYTSGTQPVVNNPMSNGDELDLELYSTANCKGKNKMIILQFADYTKFAMNFCGTFNDRLNRGLPSCNILSHYFIFLVNI